jgi:hypothetical protein
LTAKVSRSQEIAYSIEQNCRRKREGIEEIEKDQEIQKLTDQKEIKRMLAVSIVNYSLACLLLLIK